MTLRDYIVEVGARATAPLGFAAVNPEKELRPDQQRDLRATRAVFDFLVPVDAVETGALVGSAFLPGLGAALGRFAPRAAKFLRPIFGARPIARSLRVGAAAAGGEIGGQIGEFETGEGAIRGALAQLGGETLSKVAELSGRTFFGRWLGSRDRREIGEFLQEVLPELPKVKTAGDLTRIYAGGAGRLAAREAYRNSLSGISQRVGTTALNIPSYNKFQGLPAGIPMPFDEIMEDLPRLGVMAFRRGAPIETVKGFDIGRLRAEIVEEITGELQTKVGPDVAQAFTKMQSQFSKAMEMVRVFSEKNIISPDTGRIDMRRLQEVVTAAERRTGIDVRFTPTEARRFIETVVFRGAEATAMDKPGFLGLRIGGRGAAEAGPLFFLGVPRFPRFVGEPRPFTRGLARPTPLTLGVLVSEREALGPPPGPSLPMKE